jgi:drug/metabolite transporter (DMT)-like permease
MEHLWIGLAMFAALMQAVRTAAQKLLNRQLSTLATTYVRSLYGLPVMLAYLGLVLATVGGGIPQMSACYLVLTFLGALAQVIATMLLISMFRLRNFAIGSVMTKCDVVLTALIGWLFFSEAHSLGGLLALAVVMAGVLLMSLGQVGIERLAVKEALLAEPTRIAVACAFTFSLSYLFLREATLAMEEGGGFLWRGAWTVVLATAMQTLFGGWWLWRSEPGAFAALWPNRRMSMFIGVTSTLGSIAWFTAFALQNASYVRAVGQVEVVFTLLISVLYFRERINPLELAGIAATVAGVLLFRLIS